MEADKDVAACATLIGDRTRVTLLLALTEEIDGLAAGELAGRAGVSAPTASSHLGKLVAGGLITVEQRGRQRYFRLARPEVAEALESLATIAPSRPVRSLRDEKLGEAIRAARTCYDHLAGRLGVTLVEALERQGVIVRANGGYTVTRRGVRTLESFGLDVEALRAHRRPLTRACLDWSERRFHLAGALGAALTTRLFEFDWVERFGSGRAVRVTRAGAAGLRDTFGLESDSGSRR
jgi:DNA-binding transcriptional ArsR family regulator